MQSPTKDISNPDSSEPTSPLANNSSKKKFRRLKRKTSATILDENNSDNEGTSK